MTKMIIDNRATASKAYEAYIIDRAEYPTVNDIIALVYECMNSDVYKITVYENGTEIVTRLNTAA